MLSAPFSLFLPTLYFALSLVEFHNLGMLATSITPITVRVLGHSPIFRACFSASASRCKVAARKPSRKTASGAVYTEKSFLSEDSFPPTTFLQSAKLSGAINLLPGEALNLLRRYISLAKSLKNGWEREVCIESNTSPETLTLLAHILRRSPGVGQHNLANHILRTASKLGDSKATIDIVASALRQDALQNSTVADPLQQLLRLAHSGTNAKAIVLQGKIFERKNMNDSALKMYEKATSLALDKIFFTQNAEGISEAFVAKGHIFLQRKDHANAKKAFKAAALGLENPLAYYLLGSLEDQGSATQEAYFMTAAASGALKACKSLGIFYLKEGAEITSKDEAKNTTKVCKEENQLKASNWGNMRKSEGLKHAREWYELAAAEGSGEGILFMAENCKNEGKIDDAEDWLDKLKCADDGHEFTARAQKLRALLASM